MPDSGEIHTENLLPQNSSPNQPDSGNENEDPLLNDLDLDLDENYQSLAKENKHESFFKQMDESECTEQPKLMEEDETDNSEKITAAPIATIEELSTPKNQNFPELNSDDSLIIHKRDGIVLKNNEDNLFLNPNNISPILIGKPDESLLRIDEEYDEFPNAIDKDFYKRKRMEDDSFDNISLLSTDSYVAQGSATKKPKLIRTGSITRNIRRSMSFAVMKTPISNMLKSRRGSVDQNLSTCSITSFESTFNESIKKPVKEKFRMIRDKITKHSKKDSNSTPKTKTLKIASENLDSLKKVCKIKPTVRTPENKTENDSCVGFKTPLAPPPYSSTSFSTPSSSLACKTRSKSLKLSQKSATITSSSVTPITSTKKQGLIPTTKDTDPVSIDVVDDNIDTDDLLLFKKRLSPSSRMQKTSTLFNTTTSVFNELNVCPGAETMPVLTNYYFRIFFFDFFEFWKS